MLPCHCLCLCICLLPLPIFKMQFVWHFELFAHRLRWVNGVGKHCPGCGRAQFSTKSSSKVTALFAACRNILFGKAVCTDTKVHWILRSSQNFWKLLITHCTFVLVQTALPDYDKCACVFCFMLASIKVLLLTHIRMSLYVYIWYIYKNCSHWGSLTLLPPFADLHNLPGKIIFIG